MMNYMNNKIEGNTKLLPSLSNKVAKSTDQGPARAKINIFDNRDPALLKRETLDRIGYDQQALVPVPLKMGTVDQQAPGHSHDHHVVAKRPASARIGPKK